MDSEKTVKSIHHIDDLDSLRGLAILLVFLLHARPYTFYKPPEGLISLPLSFVLGGHTGVTLFFVLSAFLLASPFIQAGINGGRVSIKNFIYRRFFRIMPLYLIVLFIAAVVTSRYTQGLKGILIFWNFNLISLHPFNDVWWSLNTEIQFYILLPFIGLLFRKGKRYLILPFAVIYFSAYLMLFYSPNILAHGDFGFLLKLILSFLGRGYMFFAGIAAAWIYIVYSERLKKLFNNITILASGLSDILIIIFFLALSFLLRFVANEGFFNAERFFYWHFGEVTLWCAILLGVMLLPLKYKVILCNRVTKKLGVLSYSIYLLHYPVVYYVKKFLEIQFHMTDLEIMSYNYLIYFFIVSIITYFLSLLTYNFIEKPFLNMKRNY